MASVLEEMIDRQSWLGPVDTGLQQVANVALDQKGTTAQAVRNFLHGTWLGHPLHPALTDVPVGAWTVAAVLDLQELVTGDPSIRKGADAAIGIGLIGAAGSAVTGLNDWQYTHGAARRMGVLHGLLNAGATSLYLAAWLLRRRTDRSGRIALAMAGYMVANFSAYLGGKLVYHEKIGTDHSPQEGLPEDFVSVMRENDLPDRQLRRVEVQGVNVLVVRIDEKIYALAETCAHMGGPLSEGRLEGKSVRCPLHGSRFCLETGKALEGPSAFPQPVLDARVRDGHVELRVRRGEA